jgi:pyruvate kinase
MNVVRLNLSHGKFPEHEQVIRDVRAVSRALNIPIAILLDLPGPKIRTGSLENGKVTLKEDSTFSLVKDNIRGNEQQVSVNYPVFFNDVKAALNSP